MLPLRQIISCKEQVMEKGVGQMMNGYSGNVGKRWC